LKDGVPDMDDRVAHLVIESLKSGLNETDSPPAERLEKAFQIMAAYRVACLKRACTDRFGTVVQGGPFKGMKFLERVAEGTYIPKILGSYESELHGTIERVVASGYDVILNIGCAEGYYAVGLALRTEADIFAFDIDERARAACTALADRNDVAPRLTIGGRFEPADFDRYANRRTLVLCDIEGDETKLLDPVQAPALREMDMLVEIHSVDGAWTSERLLPRFEETHDITMIEPEPRDATRYSALAGLSDSDRFFALLERLEPTRWAFFRSRLCA
jgi:hypothetical protein